LRNFTARSSLTCIDPWEDYSSLENLPKMRHALKNDAIYSLFVHNLGASGYERVIRTVRMPSSRAFEQLRSEKFGLIYIDGNHSYSIVLEDLQNYGNLLEEGGIICGDDLELQASEVDQDMMRSAREKDCIADPRTGKRYHPGVSGAIADYFGSVSSFDGFWVMQKDHDRWLPVRDMRSEVAEFPRNTKIHERLEVTIR